MSKAAAKKPYLTKERLSSAVNSGIKQASIEAMKTAGSVVTIHDGWLVRKSRDGSMEKIKKLKVVPVDSIKKKAAKLAFK